MRRALWELELIGKRGAKPSVGSPLLKKGELSSPLVSAAVTSEDSAVLPLLTLGMPGQIRTFLIGQHQHMTAAWRLKLYDQWVTGGGECAGC